MPRYLLAPRRALFFARRRTRGLRDVVSFTLRASNSFTLRTRKALESPESELRGMARREPPGHPVANDDVVQTHDARRVVWCMEIGWRARARRHARLCVKESPLRPYCWRLLLWSHLGPLERLLDPQPAKRREAKARG